MNISVADPIEQAARHTKRILFTTFDLGKWLGLALCAWLASFGSPEGGMNFWSEGSQTNGDPFQWIDELPDPVALVLAIVVGLALALMLITAWLKARGTFMFLDGIVRNRGAVVEPWGEFRQQGNRLFGAYLALWLSGFLIVGLGWGLAAWINWEELREGGFGELVQTGAFLGVSLVMLLPILILLFCSWSLQYFVAPAMYLHRLSVMEAWRLVQQEILAPHLGKVVLFFVMTVLIGIIIAAASFAIFCMTCCVAVLPYVGTVLVLPLLVFERCYGLFFLQQFGARWRFFHCGLEDELDAGELH